ncbi:Eukaryotic translation initiation factor 3 subunit I [Balamuthia mandrillaris]
MRPLVLKGHERAITFLKYNHEGDLLFTCAKDTAPCVWYADNGERIGTYKGHSGAVWSLDVTRDSKLLLTGSGDNTAKLWMVETGEELFSWNHRAPVRCVALAHGDKKFLTVSDPKKTQKLPPTILIYKLDPDRPYKQSGTLIREISGQNYDSKIQQALWGPLNKHIFAASEDGCVYIHDADTGELVHQITDHAGPINSIVFSPDEVFFLTCSDDCTAKLYDTKTFKLLKTYETSKPVNAGSISPIKDHVLLGGGQKAAGVTQSATKAGQFQARFFHIIFEEELGTVKGHFGPINTLSFSPDGRSYASGGEDGYIRLHHLDAHYFETGLEEPDEMAELDDDEEN